MPNAQINPEEWSNPNYSIHDLSDTFKREVNMSEKVKTPYKLSRDYALLYSLISEGYEIPCWIDYDWDRKGDIVRDLCCARRRNEWTISISSRGMGYLSVDGFEREWTTLSEEKLFIQRCEKYNIEFIYPYSNSDEIDHLKAQLEELEYRIQSIED